MRFPGQINENTSSMLGRKLPEVYRLAQRCVE